MADNGSQSTGQLPPPPQPNAGAPGYENGQNASNPSHLPPPPLHIPQNNNPIPTAITSPMGGNGDKNSGGMISPGGTFSRRSAPEPNKRALYVGGLDPRVTEDVLRQIFETTGHVQNVKIIPDKNVSRPDATTVCLFNYFLGTLCPFLDSLADSPTCRRKDSTMALSSTTIPVRLSALCRPSMAAVSTNR